MIFLLLPLSIIIFRNNIFLQLHNYVFFSTSWTTTTWNFNVIVSKTQIDLISVIYFNFNTHIVNRICNSSNMLIIKKKQQRCYMWKDLRVGGLINSKISVPFFWMSTPQKILQTSLCNYLEDPYFHSLQNRQNHIWPSSDIVWCSCRHHRYRILFYSRWYLKICYPVRSLDITLPSNFNHAILIQFQIVLYQ